MPDLTPEEIYDRDIAPELLKIAAACKAACLTLTAIVEWDGDNSGRTITGVPLGPDGLLVRFAANAHGNFDALVAAALRHGPGNSYCLRSLQDERETKP